MKEKEKSHHIFLFPFRCRDRKIFKELKKNLSNKGWEHSPFQYSTENFDQNFSSQAYFYEFPARALFDEENTVNNSILTTYKYNLKNENASYKIEVVGKKEDNWSTETRIFELSIEKIELNMYDVGVCILSFHLNNYLYEKLDDILLINDFGRRIYPQFLAKGDKNYIDAPQGAFLSKSIRLKLSENLEIIEDFSSYNIPSESPFKIPRFIECFLPEDNFKDIHWLLDDRMFVISALVDDKISKEITNSYSESKDWYRYVFLDNRDCTCKNNDMLKKLIEGASYTRWTDYDSIFGITRYSFMLMTGEGGRFILSHIKNMYYKMICLCLLQRASILFYSNRIFDISKRFNQIKNNEDEHHIFEEIRKLNKDYIYFINNIYFREVTAQEQGIELYGLMQTQMRIEREVKDLSSEIEQIYQYINMTIDGERNKEASKLNKIAAIFLPATVFAGLFGMNAEFPSWLECLLIQLSFVGVATFLMYYFLNRKK